EGDVVKPVVANSTRSANRVRTRSTAIILALQVGDAGAERAVLISAADRPVMGMTRMVAIKRIALTPIAIRTGEAPAHPAQLAAGVPGTEIFVTSHFGLAGFAGSSQSYAQITELIIIVQTTGDDVFGLVVLIGAVRTIGVRGAANRGTSALATVGFIRQV